MTRLYKHTIKIVLRKWSTRSDRQRERKSGHDIKQILLCPCRITLSSCQTNQHQHQRKPTSGISFGAQYVDIRSPLKPFIFLWVTFTKCPFMAFLCKWILPKLHRELLLLLYAICKIPKAIKSTKFKIQQFVRKQYAVSPFLHQGKLSFVTY